MNDMREFFGETVSTYGDSQAVEDGVLVDAAGIIPGVGHRITRAVWEATTRDMGGAGVMTDVSGVIALAEAALAVEPDEDGWRVLELEEPLEDGYGRSQEKVWMIPNEVNGLTLMFPSDY